MWQGNNDTSGGKPFNSAEDRLFSTAMALNALLDTWTLNGGSCRRQWMSNTPSAVKNVVNMAVSWLNTFILDGTYLPGNPRDPFTKHGNFHMTTRTIILTIEINRKRLFLGIYEGYEHWTVVLSRQQNRRYAW